MRKTKNQKHLEQQQRLNIYNKGTPLYQYTIDKSEELIPKLFEEQSLEELPKPMQRALIIDYALEQLYKSVLKSEEEEVFQRKIELHFKNNLRKTFPEKKGVGKEKAKKLLTEINKKINLSFLKKQ